MCPSGILSSTFSRSVYAVRKRTQHNLASRKKGKKKSCVLFLTPGTPFWIACGGDCINEIQWHLGKPAKGPAEVWNLKFCRDLWFFGYFWRMKGNSYCLFMYVWAAPLESSLHGLSFTTCKMSGFQSP